jgi:multidrug efflux system outer membrane protein
MNNLQSYQKAKPGIAVWLVGSVAFLSAACAPLPAKDPAPRLAQVTQDDFRPSAVSAWPADGWWKPFGDPQLDALEARALANNPSMATARSRIAQAAATAGEVRASAGIDLTLDAQATRQLYSANSYYPSPPGGTYTTGGLGDLNFSYDFDFWGRNRSALQAALGERDATIADAHGAASSISASVAKAYWQWQAFNAHIALIAASEAQRKRLVALNAGRADAGLQARDDLHPLVADATTLSRDLVQLETQRDQAAEQLRALVGGGALPPLEARALPPVTRGVPADLPLGLLARRPDVAAARERVQASLSQIDSARAAFYPDFSISAFVGLDALHIGSLLRSGSREQGVTTAVSLPIFDAGRLRAALNSRRADLEAAVAEYDQSVVTAVMEVNDALVRLDGAERERDALGRQIDARRRAVAGATARADAGVADRMDVARDQVALLSAEDDEVDRHGRALAAQVDLMQALGGGYMSGDAVGVAQTNNTSR